jgi:hypothetical protein
MTARAARPDEPYQESTDYSWTEKAFAMLERGDLQGEAASRDGVVSSQVQGPCPRCRHALDDRQTHTALARPARGQRGRAGVLPRRRVVRLRRQPPGRAAGTTGCGVSFRVELPQQPVGGGRP